MGVFSTVGRMIERRLFGGTADDYWGAHAESIRVGARTFRFDFATLLARREVDGPLFDRMIQGCSFVT